MDGGIRGLLGLISDHREALAYDWRTRFALGLEDIGDTMPLHEAVGHVKILLADPSSAIAAALNGWDHPITHEALLLADLFDLQHQKAAGKKTVKPHPLRPSGPKPTERKGDAGGRTPEQVRAVLAQLRDGLLADSPA